MTPPCPISGEIAKRRFENGRHDTAEQQAGCLTCACRAETKLPHVGIVGIVFQNAGEYVDVDSTDKEADGECRDEYGVGRNEKVGVEQSRGGKDEEGGQQGARAAEAEEEHGRAGDEVAGVEEETVGGIVVHGIGQKRGVQGARYARVNDGLDGESDE